PERLERVRTQERPPRADASHKAMARREDGLCIGASPRARALLDSRTPRGHLRAAAPLDAENLDPRPTAGPSACRHSRPDGGRAQRLRLEGPGQSRAEGPPLRDQALGLLRTGMGLARRVRGP